MVNPRTAPRTHFTPALLQLYYRPRPDIMGAVLAKVLAARMRRAKRQAHGRGALEAKFKVAGGQRGSNLPVDGFAVGPDVPKTLIAPPEFVPADSRPNRGATK